MQASLGWGQIREQPPRTAPKNAKKRSEVTKTFSPQRHKGHKVGRKNESGCRPSAIRWQNPRPCLAFPVFIACPAEELRLGYLPIQNSLKILPSKSSVSIFPTTSPTASSAPRNSMETNSGDLPSSRLWRAVSSSSLAL